MADNARTRQEATVPDDELFEIPSSGKVTPDPAARAAAKQGEAPPAAPGMAGESAPGQPSRAEVFAQNPEAAAGECAAPSAATRTRSWTGGTNSPAGRNGAPGQPDLHRALGDEEGRDTTPAAEGDVNAPGRRGSGSSGRA